MATALLGGYTAYWFIGAGEIRDRVDQWADAQRMQGYEVAYAASDVTGFPFRFNILIEQPSVASVIDGWHWSGEALELSARPWDLHEVAFDLAGRHDISLYTSESWFDFACLIEGATGRLALDGEGSVREFAVEVTNLDYSQPNMAAAGGIGHLELWGRLHDVEPADFRTPSADFSLAFEDLVVPEEINWALHRHPLALALEANLTGPLPNRDAPAESLAIWRDAGGILQIDSLEMRWGPIGLESNGTLALDSQMRPLGAFSADIIGHGDIIDLLAANEFVSLGDATLYKLGFDLLARPREEGGPPTLSVPITVQDGNLLMGPIKIGEVPSILPATPPAAFGEAF